MRYHFATWPNNVPNSSKSYPKVLVVFCGRCERTLDPVFPDDIVDVLTVSLTVVDRKVEERDMLEFHMLHDVPTQVTAGALEKYLRVVLAIIGDGSEIHRGALIVFGDLRVRNSDQGIRVGLFLDIGSDGLSELRSYFCVSIFHGWCDGLGDNQIKADDYIARSNIDTGFKLHTELVVTDFVNV